eukprot:1219145-Rhodomonas_salina.2
MEQTNGSASIPKTPASAVRSATLDADPSGETTAAEQQYQQDGGDEESADADTFSREELLQEIKAAKLRVGVDSVLVFWLLQRVRRAPRDESCHRGRVFMAGITAGITPSNALRSCRCSTSECTLSFCGWALRRASKVMQPIVCRLFFAHSTLTNRPAGLDSHQAIDKLEDAVVTLHDSELSAAQSSLF